MKNVNRTGIAANLPVLLTSRDNIQKDGGRQPDLLNQIIKDFEKQGVGPDKMQNLQTRIDTLLSVGDSRDEIATTISALKADGRREGRSLYDTLGSIQSTLDEKARALRPVATRTQPENKKAGVSPGETATVSAPDDKKDAPRRKSKDTLESSLIKGLTVKRGSGTIAEAQVLLTEIEKMYTTDQDFKANLDRKLARNRKLTFSLADLGNRGKGRVLGQAKRGGKKITIDRRAVGTPGNGNIKLGSYNGRPYNTHKVIAHEFLHSLGLNHSPAMDKFTEKLSDGV